MSKLGKLAEQCAFSHAPTDVVEHLEEELIELLLAIKRWKKGKGSLREVIEEACDVRSEVATFGELLIQYRLATADEIEEIKAEKLDKFEAMLESEKSATTLVDRYLSYLKDFTKRVFH